MELLEMLHSPSREFTPIPFWFLNGDLTDAGLREQLADFVAHGVYGVVLHPRMGLPRRIGYLSKTFFHYIRTAVCAAAELDMKIVLYDEGMYPSGSAGGQVVAGHPEFASEGIALTEEVLPGDEILCQVRTDGGRFLVARKSGGTMRGIHWGEDDGEPGAPATADILNPLAVDRFIELTHEAYYRELKEYFGTTIVGFFTDEPSILGRNVAERPAEKGMLPWTHGFAEEFRRAGGHLEGLTPLFMETSPHCARETADTVGKERPPHCVRRQVAPSIKRNAAHLDAGGQAISENDDVRLYHELILQRECEVYYGKLSSWCAAHGIALMGHPHQSDDIEVQRYFHVPGQDLVGRRLAPEKNGLEGIDSTMAKCSADAARLMGRRRNSNECFGDCNKDGNPWNLSGGDLKWYLDWLAVRGVNLFIPHAFYYSVKGKRSGERPPDVGRNNIWWPHYHLWSDYMRRLSALMTDVELVAPVAVFCRNRALCPEKVAPLYERQIGFQYIPESEWDKCNVAPSIERNASHLDGALEANLLADCICDPPASSLRCAHFFRNVEPPHCCSQGENQPFTMREARHSDDIGVECWFLVNEGNEPIETRILLSCANGAQPQYVGQYDLWTDEARRFSSQMREKPQWLCLDRRESLLLFACTAEAYQELPREMAPQEVGMLSCPKLTCIQEDPEHVRKIYVGTLTVHSENKLYKQLILPIEAEEMAELTINGKNAGVSFWSPHDFDVTDLVQEGKNEIWLTVTGSLAIRYGRPVPYGVRGDGYE